MFFSSLFSFQNHLPMLKGVKRVHIGPGCKDFFPFSLRRWFLSSYFESKPESSQSFHAFCEAETSNFYWILIRDPISWCQMSSSYMYILCSSCLPKALRQQLATYDKRFDGATLDSSSISFAQFALACFQSLKIRFVKGRHSNQNLFKT